MKIRHNHLLYLPTTIMLFTLWVSKPVAASPNGGNPGGVGGRRKKSDSILEIMNTEKIEKLLEQRRLNMTLARTSSNQNNPLIIQNDLNEDFMETSSLAPRFHHHYHNQQHGGKTERYKIQNKRHKAHRQEEYEYGNYEAPPNQRRRHHKPQNQQQITTSVDNLMPYNDTILPSDGRIFSTPDSESDLIDSRFLQGDKLLKSSKNALYITKKEYLKKDWCKTEPLIQRIREPGCLTRSFINHFCYGQCNSFFIPKGPRRKKNNNRHNKSGGGSNNAPKILQADHFEDEDLTGAAFQSCGFCKPKKYIWITVTLRCPSLVPQLRKKRIQKIKQCRCMAEPV